MIEKFVFRVTFFDLNAELEREYNMFFWPKDNSVQMFDLKAKRLFLKRTIVETVSPKQLYIGSKINVFGRQLTIKEFGDTYTKDTLGSKKSTIVGVAGSMKNICNVLKICSSNSWQILMVKSCILSDSTATNAGVPPGKGIIFAVSGTGVSSDSFSGVSISPTPEKALELFRSTKQPTTAEISSRSSIIVIKPCAVVEGHAGDILFDVLAAGFEVVAIEALNLSPTQANSFLEVYKGVVREFNSLTEELTKGLIIVLEIVGENAVSEIRELAGPHDPVIAKHIRPDTLRAKYGHDIVRNAVHCTDLKEDGILESEFFFKLLQ